MRSKTEEEKAADEAGFQAFLKSDQARTILQKDLAPKEAEALQNKYLKKEDLTDANEQFLRDYVVNESWKRPGAQSNAIPTYYMLP